MLDMGHGKFTATAANPRSQFVRTEACVVETGRPAGPHSSQGAARWNDFSPCPDEEMDTNVGLNVAPDAGNSSSDRRAPTALLVEFRDEVFIRLATDVARTGMRVIRACSADEALELASATTPSLVLANVEQPDQSGWLLTAKLKMIDPCLRVWLYLPRSSTYQALMAEFLDVEELLAYRGDLLGLSDMVVQLLDNDPQLIDATNSDELLVA